MQGFTNSMSSCNLPQQSQSGYPFMSNSARSYETLSLGAASGYSQHHSHAAAAAAALHNQRSSCQVGYAGSQQQSNNPSPNGKFEKIYFKKSFFFKF